MNSRVKTSARAALLGSRRETAPLVFATTVSFLLFSVCNAAVNYFPALPDGSARLAFSAGSLVASVVVSSFLGLVFQARTICLAEGRKRPRGGVRFIKLLEACGLKIYLFFAKLLIFVGFELVPAASAAFFLIYLSKKPTSLRAAAAITAGLASLAAAGLIFYGIAVQRYSKATFYLVRCENFTPLDATRESVANTRGRLAEIFFFKLSFAPWFLLCLGIFPAFYVVPYYRQSVACLFLRG